MLATEYAAKDHERYLGADQTAHAADHGSPGEGTGEVTGVGTDSSSLGTDSSSVGAGEVTAGDSCAVGTGEVAAGVGLAGAANGCEGRHA
jgi:hypothetical protein